MNPNDDAESALMMMGAIIVWHPPHVVDVVKSVAMMIDKTNMMTNMMHQGPDDRPNMELGFQEHFWRNGGATEQGFKYI